MKGYLNWMLYVSIGLGALTVFQMGCDTAQKSTSKESAVTTAIAEPPKSVASSESGTSNLPPSPLAQASPSSTETSSTKTESEKKPPVAIEFPPSPSKYLENP